MAPAETQIRRFVSGQLRDCPDLSTLTLGILRGRYLACVGRDSLSQEDRQLMKRVVEEELMRMQDSDSSDNDAILDVTPTPRLNKRKRGEEKTTANGGWTKADGSKAKRSRLQSAQSDSPDSGIERVGNGERPREEEEEKDMGSDVEDEQVPQIGTKKNAGRHKGKHNGGKMEMSSEGEVEIKTVNQRKTELASDEEDEEEVDENKKKKQGDRKQETDKVNSDSDSEEDKEQNRRRRTTGGKDVKVQSKVWKGNRRRESGNEEKGKPVRRRERVQADGSDLERIGEAEVIEQKMVERPSNDNGSTSESEGEKNDCGASSEEASGGEEETEEVMAKTKDEPAPDSDSGSSLPSLEDEQESEVRPEQVKKRKPVAKQPVKGRGSERGSKGGKEDEAKAVARLRRYIALCGARRNFKKLLDGCRSIKSKVAVLKRELEELGVEGQPSIEKCKKARLKREEAQELADLDVSNIITTQGRPKRRGSSTWQQQSSPPSSAYKRVVNSSSDSGEDSRAGRGRKRATDWSNLKGIISDGADSD